MKTKRKFLSFCAALSLMAYEHEIDKSILTFLQEFNRDGWRVFWSPVL